MKLLPCIFSIAETRDRMIFLGDSLERLIQSDKTLAIWQFVKLREISESIVTSAHSVFRKLSIEDAIIVISKWGNMLTTVDYKGQEKIWRQIYMIGSEAITFSLTLQEQVKTK